MDVELAIDTLHVRFHGIVAERERVLDVAAVVPAGEQGQHLLLAGGEAPALRKPTACPLELPVVR